MAAEHETSGQGTPRGLSTWEHLQARQWRSTPLGAIGGWTVELRTGVDLMLAQQTPTVICVGPQRTMIYNLAFARLIGAEHPAALGADAREFVGDARGLADAIDQAFAGETVTIEEGGHLLDGRNGRQDAAFNISFSPIRDITGKVFAVIAVHHATASTRIERARAELALVQSRERFAQVIEVAGLATWDWALDSDRLEWSPGHYRMAGYRPDDVQPSPEAWASRIHPDDRPATLAVFEAAKAPPGLYAHTFRFLHPDGKIVWCKAHGHFFYDEAGRPVRMTGIMDDITALMASSERQEALLNRQAVLVAELQHRTRNLLAVVQSISTRTLESSQGLDDFSPRFNARLSALSRVQGLLSRADPARITIGMLVRMGLEALGGAAIRERIVMSGPEVPMRSSAVQTMALALHELATNALKYGALAADNGVLIVGWRVEEADERWLKLEWREEGVRTLDRTPAPRSGYGRELIERALPYALDATTHFHLGKNTVCCTIALPLDRPGSPERAR